MKKISLIFSIVFLAFTFLGGRICTIHRWESPGRIRRDPHDFCVGKPVPLPAEKGMKRLLEKEDGQRALPCGRREYQREEPPCF